MKSKLVVPHLAAAFLLAAAYPVFAMEEKPHFVSIVPNHLATASFHDRLQPDARMSASVVSSARHVAFVETAHAGHAMNNTWRYTPPVAEAKKWALFGVGLTLLGMFARHKTLTQT